MVYRDNGFRGNVAKRIDDGELYEVSPTGAFSNESLSHTIKKNPLDELFHNKPVRTHIKEFALIFAIILLGVAAYFAYKRYPLSDVLGFMFGAAVLVVAGYRTPALLKPVWEGWMKFAEGLGKVMTFLLLSIMWVGMFIPVAFFLRLMRKEVINMRFREPQLATYWETRESALSDFKLVERQY